MMKTPIAFLIFNRPDTTQKVFDAIRQAKPQKLLVVADGPRADRPGEADKCAATRAIIDGVDWECDVLTNYSEVNLGCKQRVSSGLDWAFNTVEEAIILEDDCLPHPSFFDFCEELLDYYRHDERIAVIAGCNFQGGQRRTDYSYYFSLYNHCWGWASWRRAWKYYDGEMKHWPEIRDQKWLNSIFDKSSVIYFWNQAFQSVYENKLSSWATAWAFSCWLQNRLTIIPNVNLVSNIGFGKDSTHTSFYNTKKADIATEVMAFPLKHPPLMIRNFKADSYTEDIHYSISCLSRVKTKLRKIIKI